MSSLDKKPLVIEQGLIVQLDKTIGELIEALNQEVLDKKVDKVEGKGLSDNNFTSSDKSTVEQLKVVVPQDEAEAGVASGIRSWTAQRVRQAINAWWQIVTSGFGRNFIAASNEQAARNVLQLGTAASRDVGTGAGNVMQVGAGGWLANSPNTYIGGFPQELSQSVSQIYRRTTQDGVVPAFTASFHFAAGDTWGRLRVNYATPRVWVQGGNLTNGWTTEVLHTDNILASTGQSTEFPMTQKAVTDAINGISDERDKTDVNEIDLGLEVIENINTFSFKLNKRDWYRQQAAKELIEVEEDGKVITQEKINDDVLNTPLSEFEENDGSLKRDDVYTGFVAQDLKETLESLDLGHLGIVKNYAEEYEGGEDRFYIEHLALLPFLVNSIKQLSARVKELEDVVK